MIDNQQPLNWYPPEKEAMRPAERVLPSEWIQKHFRLPEDSAVKGYYSLDLTPQFKPVLDDLVSDDVDEIYLCSSAQSGKTTTILGGVAYVVRQKKWSGMIVLADENTADEISVKRIAPAFENDEELSKAIDWNSWTKTVRGFTSGNSITMAWASSVSQTASRSMGIVYADEIDKPGYYLATKEGDRLAYIKQRMETFPGSKFLASSTCTDEDGNIISVSKLADVLVFDWHVPCPFCGQFQPMRFSRKYAYGFQEGKYRAEDGTMRDLGQVVWEGGGSATVKQIFSTTRYECGECKKLWTTAQKNEAVRHGKPVPRTEPQGQRKHYYHNNRLISLFPGGKLEKIVNQFVSIQRMDRKEDQDKQLQTFVQSVLAEPFKKVLVDIKQGKLLNARCALPPQVVPAEAIALECAIDVQKTGRWFRVRAWAKDSTSWLIDYGLLADWEEIESLLYERTYPVQDSTDRMGIWRACVDTGGGDRDEGPSMTEDTYLWLDRNYHRGVRLYATKGASRSLGGRKCKLGENLVRTPSGKALRNSLQLILLDTDMLKEAFHYRLGLAIDGQPQGAYLHAETDDLYASHITAEEKIRDPKTGVEEWVKKRPRNDLLDCECMGLACVDRSWPAGGINLLRNPVKIFSDIKQEEPPQDPRKKEPGKDWFGAQKTNNWFRR